MPKLGIFSSLSTRVYESANHEKYVGTFIDRTKNVKLNKRLSKSIEWYIGTSYYYSCTNLEPFLLELENH